MTKTPKASFSEAPSGSPDHPSKVSRRGPGKGKGEGTLLVQVMDPGRSPPGGALQVEPPKPLLPAECPVHWSRVCGGERAARTGPGRHQGERVSLYCCTGRRKTSVRHCQVLIGLLLPIKAMPLSKGVSFMFSPTNALTELLNSGIFQIKDIVVVLLSIPHPLSATHTIPQTALTVINPRTDACLNS